MSDKEKNYILELVREPLAHEGFEVVDMALSRYRTSTTLRLYVHGTNGGPSLGQCSHLSSLVGEIIDGTELFKNGYTLEVSSPGLDRPLITAKDYSYRIGETVRLEFVDPKRKKQTAEIVGVTEEHIEFRDENGSFSIPVIEIARAKIVF
jgi:ribosome maturation factor RimP